MIRSAGLKWAILVVLAICLSPSAAAPAQSPKKIVVFPFETRTAAPAPDLQKIIHAEIITELLKSGSIRLTAPSEYAPLIENRKMDENLALSAGARVGADLAVLGSISRFGNILSIDARMLDVKTRRSLGSFFVQGPSGETPAPLARQLAERIVMASSGERKIAAVRITGNRKIEENAVLNVIRGAKGKFFSAADLTADIKAIYKMGYFTDVKATVDDVPEGKVITFILEEKPVISEIQVRGNRELETKDIEDAAAAKARQFLDMDRLQADAEKIRNLYAGKGFLNAEVKVETEKRGDRDALVVFNIIEGDRIYIKTITFEGNRAYTGKELKNMMETNEWGIFHFFTDSGVLKRDKLKEDINKLNAFYLNNGFIHAKVGEPEITNDKKWIYVKVPVSEGKRFRVGKVEIEGELPAAPVKDLREKLKITKEVHYDREAIMRDVDYLTQALNDEGFAYADVSPLTTPKEKEQVVDITYTMKKGEKVHFNRITISGNTKTRDKVIRRELGFAEGELYNRAKLKTSYMNLGRLRYFEEVDFQTEKGAEKDSMDVNIRVKEKPTGMFSIGAGYSAVDQAVISGQVVQSNLFGRGQSLGLNTALSANSSTYDIYFIEPWLFDIPLWSKYEIWHMDRAYDTYDLNSKGFGVTFGYPLWPSITGYLGYRLSMDTINNISTTASKYIKEQEGETITSSMTGTLLRDTTDDYIFPTMGSRNSISVEHAGTILQGNASYTKTVASSSWFFPIASDIIFGVRGRAGHLLEQEGKKVPVYSRFYLGGINSLRGLRSVGPIDPETKDVIGGLTMLNFNAEVVFPLVKNAGMKGVIFYDTGNTWESGYQLGDMRKTAGTGIRWYSPIGPLRLEWGYVLDRKDDEPASRWEFTIGFFM